MQLCTVRDGPHGAAQRGIYGEAGKGAYLIVLSDGNHHSNVDKGDTIWYSGTDSKDETPTENTGRMLDSIVIFVVGFQSPRLSITWAFNHHLYCRLSIAGGLD
jgi:hypothetical protein